MFVSQGLVDLNRTLNRSAGIGIRLIFLNFDFLCLQWRIRIAEVSLSAYLSVQGDEEP